MLKIILFIFIVYVIFRILRKLSGTASSSRAGRQTPAYTEAPRQVNEMVQDPVCMVYVPKKDALYLEQGGTRYYFCSRNCMDAFRERDITK